jgi:hypothetical protein
MKYKADTKERFINKAKLIHGDTYDYSLVDYMASNIKVKIICKVHGIFIQKPSHHKDGQGCPICGRLWRRKQLYVKTKVCKLCGIEFERTTENFYKSKTSLDGLTGYCVNCNRERSRNWVKKNTDKIIESGKRYNLRKKEMGKYAIYAKKRRSDPHNKLLNNFYSHIWNVLNRYSKSGDKYFTHDELLGCSGKELFSYIESKFTDGMSWENYGRDGWWIDHIRPCVSFNLNDMEEQKQCFHYTNLQPLWAFDNMSKSSWYDGIKYRKK